MRGPPQSCSNASDDTANTNPAAWGMGSYLVPVVTHCTGCDITSVGGRGAHVHYPLQPHTCTRPIPVPRHMCLLKREAVASHPLGFSSPGSGVHPQTHTHKPAIHPWGPKTWSPDVILSVSHSITSKFRVPARNRGTNSQLEMALHITVQCFLINMLLCYNRLKTNNIM